MDMAHTEVTSKDSAQTSSITEQELLAGLLRDAPDCWEGFFTRYDRLIYRCITRVTSRFPGIITQEDIREIYANVLVNLLHRDKHKLRSYDPSRGSKLGSWIGLISINTAYDYLRTLSRQPNSGSLTEASDHPSPSQGPFEKAALRERLDQLAHTLGGFSERDRLFVSLYYLEERDPSEVAEIMGISVKTVYTKKHKLRLRLCQQLEAQSELVA
jgi:RNA polymerase sigma-70 factor (ECF subfamily)